MSLRTIRRRTHQIMENNFNCPPILNKGPHHIIIPPEMYESICKRKQRINTSRNQNALLEHFEIPNDQISISTIYCHLDGNFVSYKKLRYVSVNANTSEIIKTAIKLYKSSDKFIRKYSTNLH